MQITLTKRGSLAVIVIFNPPMNVLSGAVLTDLLEHINAVKNDDTVKLVIITGQVLFSIGANVEEIFQLSQLGDRVKVLDLLAKANAVSDAIEALNKPTIAAIERFCLGGGNEIAMACTYRIATEDTKFGQPEVKLGILPGMGGTQRLPRIVGVENAMPYLLTGEMFDAKKAQEMGLVDAVAPGKLMPFVKEWLEKNTALSADRKKYLNSEAFLNAAKTIGESDRVKQIVARAIFPGACGAIIQSVSRGMAMTLADGLSLEQEFFTQQVLTNEARVGLTKYLEKRSGKPQPKQEVPSARETEQPAVPSNAGMLNQLRETVRDFMNKAVRPKVNEMEGAGRVPPELLRQMAEMGFFGIPFSEDCGGLGLGKTGYCIFMEEMSRVNGSLTAVVGAHVGLACTPIALFGTLAQKETYLKAGIEGRMLGAFALTEPNAGSDAFNLSTTAERQTDGSWVLNGGKRFITNGDIADFVLVFAQTDKLLGNNGIGVFIVEKQWPGFSAGKPESKMGLHASRTTTLAFDNVKVPAENLLGEIGQGYKIAMLTLNGGRLSLAAGCLGAAKEAAEIAYKDASQRTRFGRLLIEQQIIQQYFGQMASLIYLMESGIYRAARDADLRGLDAVRAEAAALKLTCSEMSEKIIDLALQVLGGEGYMEEYPIARMYRDSRVNRIFEGTNEIQLLSIFKEMFRRGGLFDKIFNPVPLV